MCEAVACVPSASRLSEEAHGANSCHGETLTPLNAQSSKQRWAEHMPARGGKGVKKVNEATQLTPWRKEN